MRPDIDKLEDWASCALEWATQVLDANPPGGPDKNARAEALLAVDDVLHIGASSELRAVQRFYRSRIDRAVRQIRSEQVESGAVVWKMYNHGFVIKTSEVTIGLDLVRGYGATAIDDELSSQLASQLDVATISHRHADHADLDLCRAISDSGGQILVPQDLFERWSDYGGLNLVRMPPGCTHDVPGIRFEAIEGHHDGPPDSCDLNMYYLLTTEGISVLHTGDHWINRRMPLSHSDEEFLERLQEYAVDLLLVNRSPYHFQTIIDKIKPLLAISSHENELSHDIAARATYSSSLNQLSSIETESLTMAWGEKHIFIPRISSHMHG